MMGTFLFSLFVVAIILFLVRLVVYWTHCSDAIEGISELQDRQNAKWLYEVYFPDANSNYMLIFQLNKWSFEDFFPGLARHIF